MKSAVPVDCYLIPVVWIKSVFLLGSGILMLFGAFAFLFPSGIIRFYIWSMKRVSWTVAPMHPEREVRNTRWMGLITLILGTAILLLQWRR